MKRALPYLAAAASGAAMALALPLVVPFLSIRQVDPAGWLEPVAWVALVPALLALRSAPSMRAAALRGLVAGLAYFFAAIYWVSNAMTEFGGLSLGLSLVALSLLVLYMAAHWAAAFAVAWTIRARLGWPLYRHLPLVWAAFELLAELPLLRVPVGEPRLHAGADAARSRSSPRSRACTRIAALVVLVNAALAEAIAARRERRPLPRAALVATAAVLALVGVHGELRLRHVRARMAEAPKLTVGVVQPNVNQSVKNKARDNREYILDRLVPLTVEADRRGADLVAWPESSYPMYLSPGVRSLALPGYGLPALSRAHLLMGAATIERLRGDDGRRVSRVGNVNLLLTPDLEVLGAYQKHHLVPFGEYVPAPGVAPVPAGRWCRASRRPRRARTSRVLAFPAPAAHPPTTPAVAAPAGSARRARPRRRAGRGARLRAARADDLLRRDLPGDQRRVRAPAARAGAARELHERRLVRLLVRAIPVPRDRPDARDRGGQGGGAARLRGRLGGAAPDRRAGAGRARGRARRSRLAPRIRTSRRGCSLAEVPRLRGRTPYTTVGDLFAYASALFTAAALAAGAPRRPTPPPRGRSGDPRDRRAMAGPTNERIDGARAPPGGAPGVSLTSTASSGASRRSRGSPRTAAFWTDNAKAQALLKEKAQLEAVTAATQRVRRALDDAQALARARRGGEGRGDPRRGGAARARSWRRTSRRSSSRRCSPARTTAPAPSSR